MRSSRLLASLALVVASFTASANTYVANCYGSICLPFTTSNTYVQGLAVAAAQANNATVNDTIVVSFEPHHPSSCEFRHMIWSVSYAPVYQYQDLTFNEQICEKTKL